MKKSYLYTHALPLPFTHEDEPLYAEINNSKHLKTCYLFRLKWPQIERALKQEVEF